MKSFNFWKYRFKYLFGQYLPLSAPVDISLELSSLCNMHCSYCIDPKTPILTSSSLEWKPIEDLQVGEKIVSFDEYSPPGDKSNRSMRIAEVEKIWRTRKESIRISTTHGEITCSLNHKFLDSVGRWKDAETLKIGNQILFGREPWEVSDILDRDYMRGYLVGMTAGDGTVRWKPLKGSTGKTDDPRRQIWWRMALKDKEPLLRILAYFELLGIEHNGIKGFAKTKSSYADMFKVEIRKRAQLDKLFEILYHEKSVNEQDFQRGYLAGIFDSEGSFSEQGILRISQKQKNDVVEKTMAFLSEIEVESVKEQDGLRVLGSFWDKIRFLGIVQPAIKRKLSQWVDKGVRHTKATILSIEPLGMTDLIDIQTSTRTFYGAGFATHNCYHADKKNLPFKMNFMKWETAEKIISEAAALKVSSLKMNWRGESTLNPIFPKVCHYAKSLASSETFIDRLTNSNFKFDTLSDHIFSALACQTKVKVSYDSFRKDIFEKQRAGGDHDITTANIEKFYNWPNRKTEIVIQAVRTQANKDEDFEGEIKKRWPSAHLSLRDVVEGRLNKDISNILVRKRDVENRQTCLQAHVRLIFDSFGRASPCCPDIKNQLVVGNIHEQSLYEIFNSELAKQLRKDLKCKKAFEKDPCKNCSSHETFKGYKPSLVS